MRNFFLLILTLQLISGLSAQTNDTIIEIQYIYNPRTIYPDDEMITPFNSFNIRTSPLSLIDSYSGSSYKAGTEFKVFNKTAICLEVGGYFRNFNGLKNIKGYILDFSLRRYVESKPENLVTYISVNYFYNEQSFDFRDSFMDVNTYVKEFRTQKYVTCLNLNVGHCSISSDRLLIDMFAGIGVRFKRSFSTLSEKELDLGKEYRESSSLSIMVGPGRFTLPNFNVGFRIGFVIK